MCIDQSSSIKHPHISEFSTFPEKGDKKCLGHVYGVHSSSNELGQFDVEVAKNKHSKFCHESILYVGQQAVLVQFHFDNDPECHHYIHKIDAEAEKAAFKRFSELFPS